MDCGSVVLHCSHARFTEQLFSQCFIIISACQLTLLDFKQPFYSSCNISRPIHVRGWAGRIGVEEGRGGVGRHRQHCCVFNKCQKWTQPTRQDQTAVGSNLAPHTSLLMSFTNSTGPVVDFHGLTGMEKLCVKQTCHPLAYAWCVWIVLESSCNALKDACISQIRSHNYADRLFGYY